jgi:two-component system, LytTR family, response regulator
MLLRSIVIDDEKMSREVIQTLVTDHCPEVGVVGEADCIEDARGLINEMRPDLIFLDIEMPKSDGFSLLQSLNVDFHFQTIFVTAFNLYTLKAIRYGATDYLLKPIDVNELKIATKKAVSNYLELTQNPDILEKLQRKILIPHSKGLKVIRLADIVRLEADNNYTFVYLRDEPRIVASRPIKEFENKLDSWWFFRLHKSHIINLYYLKEYLSEDGGCALMGDAKRVPISRLKTDEFLFRLSKMASRF